MSVKTRVQKHRDKLRAVLCRRLEVHLPNDLIDAANTFARQYERYLRHIIAYALQDYLTRHGVWAPLR